MCAYSLDHITPNSLSLGLLFDSFVAVFVYFGHILVCMLPRALSLRLALIQNASAKPVGLTFATDRVICIVLILNATYPIVFLTNTIYEISLERDLSRAFTTFLIVKEHRSNRVDCRSD